MFVFLFASIVIISFVFISFLAVNNKRKLGEVSHRLKIEQRRVRQQAVLNDTVSTLAGELDINAVAEIVLDGAKSLNNAENSALVTLKNGRLSGFYSSLGPSKECKAEVPGTIKKLIEEGLPIRGNDIAKMEGFKGFPDRHPAIKSILMVPVLHGSEIIGVLMSANSLNPEGFSSEDEDSLLALAFQASSAIEKANLFNEVMRLAATDGLTGLVNHKTFKERLSMELERAIRFNREVSLLMLDIDHFKAINDTFGHPQGDEILRAVSMLIVECIRNVDCAARYGGEEFAVILIESNLDNSKMIAERIREMIECYEFMVSYVTVKVTVSIGVATYPKDAGKLDELIERADRALYYSKEHGRNQVAAFKDLA